MWHHRSKLLDSKDGGVNVEDVKKELDLVGFVVSNDSKNYHAWQHRVCLLQTYREKFEFEQELVYVQGLIGLDYRNNSAWNYLYTLHKEFEKLSTFNSSWLYECMFTINALDLQNESSWSFLSGIWSHLTIPQKTQFFDKATQLAEELS